MQQLLAPLPLFTRCQNVRCHNRCAEVHKPQLYSGGVELRLFRHPESRWKLVTVSNHQGKQIMGTVTWHVARLLFLFSVVPQAEQANCAIVYNLTVDILPQEHVQPYIIFVYF